MQNGDVNTTATTWTFHLRPHLLWSDGQPYDARDVDFTWQLRRNPKIILHIQSSVIGLNLIGKTDVSADHLSITFHLKRPFAPFLSYWVDGLMAPLPAHHFSTMAPEQILKSPDNLNPQVTSGPFMMAESVPGDHYTVVRNPRYYRAREGLPYLDKVVFRIVGNYDTVLKDLQAGSIDSADSLDERKLQQYQRLTAYTLVYPLTSSDFEAIWFNFHNTVLASHREVRQAMAMAVDQQALIQARNGLARPSCTDHGSALHPGYDPNAPCPVFDLTAANKLLDDNGWVKGADGVRAKGGQRLEFEYSTSVGEPWRVAGEVVLQSDFRKIGIKLDIQNYPPGEFFTEKFWQGPTSPPSGAVAGRFDIAEFGQNILNYDPDDATLLACDQALTGYNFGSYCNPALDALYKQEQETVDAGVRQQIFIQIHQIYLTEFPFIVLHSPLDLAMVRKRTHNYQPGPFITAETTNIWEWWCDNGKC